MSSLNLLEIFIRSLFYIFLKSIEDLIFIYIFLENALKNFVKWQKIPEDLLIKSSDNLLKNL